MRQNIILECSKTNERLYLTSKNKQNHPDRLELMKYSPKTRQREIFKEVK
ncbi:50S ribosomal protein L33 [Companilactobacillus nantensis]|nr:50S ribosomal protein L33 [Companilactobacillus nantensis]GEO63730.1 50S ribosomal protein L33 1 [Companilactobacillus nantensis]